MSDESQGPPLPPTQFDRGETPEEAGPTCSACHQPIGETYYTVGKALFCPGCRELADRGLKGGSRAARLVKAVILGIGGAVLAGVIWYYVRKGTGKEYGLVAIGVGLLVGGAVRAGSNARGGWGYQLLAIALTYSCIAFQYVPDLLEMVRERAEEKRQGIVAADNERPSTTAPAASRPTSRATGSTKSTGEPDEPRPTAGGAALALVVLIGLILAVPILAGVKGNPIGLLILGFALFEAWTLNKRRMIQFAGPFNLSPPEEEIDDTDAS